MDDLISRKEAIDELRKFKPEIIPYEKARIYVKETVKTMYDRIVELPTIQPEPKWIPVSERLPEDTQYVLLTVRRLNNAYNSTPFISVGYIGWNQHHWWCAHDGDCEISKVEVLAWMPLPELYKPNK